MRHVGRAAAIISLLAAGGLAGGFPTVPASAAAYAATPPAPAVPTIHRSSRTGLVTFVGTARGHALARPAGVARRDPAAVAARAFATEHADAFGLTAPQEQLAVAGTAATAGGGHVVRLAQRVGGYPVLGGQLVVALTAGNAVAAVDAHTTPADVALPVPRVSPAAARETARGITARAEGLPLSVLAVGAATLTVYDPAVLGVPRATPATLAYRVEVDALHAAHPVRELVVVDAVTGGVDLHVNQVEADGFVTTVCDAHDTAVGQPVDDPTCPPVGPGQPTVVPDPQAAGGDAAQAASYAAATYRFYADVAGDATKLGLAAPDGVTRALNSTINYCDPDDVDDSGRVVCPMDNAFWDGSEMVYGTGYSAADDVVGHELTHGVTEHTSNLFYLYQSGAINESISDVMGELMDQTDGLGTDDAAVRWELGEDLPGGDVVRRMDDPTRDCQRTDAHGDCLGDPDRMTSPLWFGGYDQGELVDNGGVHVNSGVGNKAAYLMVEGGTFDGVTVPGLVPLAGGDRLAAATKAAHLYLRADEMLASAADYADLAAVLPQACDLQVGTVGITPADCATVRAAVAAVAMAAQPLTAAAPDAPVCGAAPVDTLWADSFEQPADRAWTGPRTNGTWRYDSGYATSGARMLVGDDPDTAADASAAMTTAVRVPRGKITYVRFDHAYLFDWDAHGFYDGGTVDYAVDGGPWRSAAPLFDFGGYDRTIASDRHSQTTYRFAGFGGDSHGYVASRLRLPASLAGHAVRIRFRVRSDDDFGAAGWFVDNVRFYTCGAGPSAPERVVVRPGLGLESVTWSAPTDRGLGAITGYRVWVTRGTSMVRSVDLPASARAVTVRGLPAGVLLRTYVAALTAAGPGPSGHTYLWGTTLSAARSGSVLTGRLVRAGTSVGLPGRTVLLQSRASGSGRWHIVASAVTGRGGVYRVPAPAHAGIVYRVRFTGAASYQGVVSRTLT